MALRVAVIRDVTGDTSHGYIYSATQPHTVTQINTSGPAGTDSVSYGYDSTGNTTSRPDGAGATQTLAWNIEGKLTKVANDTAETTFVYDVDGERLIRHDPNGGGVLFMGATEVRADTSGAATGVRYYSGTAVRVDGALTWLGVDHHATGQIAVKAADLSVTRRRLDPYGNHRADPVAWPGEKGFVNGTQDPTGLTHLGAREYDPVIGRFISVDPLIDHDDPQSMQGYAYANNNSVSFSDPDGEALIGDNRGEYRAYKKYKYYKKRGGGYKKRSAGYKIRDWRTKNRNKVAKKRAAAEKRAAAKSARQ